MGNGSCNPELSLRLGSGHHSSSADSDTSRLSKVADWFVDAMQAHQQQQPQQLQQQYQHQQQQIAIFYNGRICVCDVTEIQARAIICMAKREMEERRMARKNHQRSDDLSWLSSPSSLAPPLINPGLSMKRSLQMFLQKRKTRMDAAAPYNRTAEWERRSPSLS